MPEPEGDTTSSFYSLGLAGNPPTLGVFETHSHGLLMPMLTNYLLRPYNICGITCLSIILFLAVDELEPNRRLAVILQCALLATGGGAIANQLMS